MKDLPPNISHIYQELEWIETSAKDTSIVWIKSFWVWLSKASRELSTTLFGELKPRVWEYMDHSGQSWWMIQDPLADQPFRTLSINDTRIWLEQQYLSSPNQR